VTGPRGSPLPLKRSFQSHTLRPDVRHLAAEERRGLLKLWAEGYGRSMMLAVLRGALLDLLATGDLERVGAAVERHLELSRPAPER
jgi:hypothetical protein